MNLPVSNGFTLLLTPLRPMLRAGQANTLEVLVRLQAPDAPAGLGSRPAQAIALVLDRSGSMNGRPLHEARRCAAFAVSRLRSIDAASLVQFDNRVQPLWPATPLADPAPLLAAIERIEAGGSTNLHGGWLEGAGTLKAVAGQGLKRVILLSDGCANQGVTDPQVIADQCAQWAERGITTSTYGLGDHFNEALMVAMARAGGGNHYYGDSANDLMEPFQQELDLLANLALRRVRLQGSVPETLGLALVNDLPSSQDGWHLADLAWGVEAWAVLRITVPQGAVPPIGAVLPLLTVRAFGAGLDGEPVVLAPVSLELPVRHPAEADAQIDDELVHRRLLELAAARMLSQMRGAAHASDWDEVDRLLAESLERFSGNEWVMGILQAMTVLARARSRERMAKESMYSSTQLGSRLAGKDEADVMMSASESPSYLRRKSMQGKTEV